MFKHTVEGSLVEHGTSSRKSIRNLVLGCKLIPYVCAICNMLPSWQGADLVLRLDHINGKNRDHRLENLRFVCPNCDSQLPTYCGRNRKIPGRGKRTKSCSCGRKIWPRSIMCRRCRSLTQNPIIKWPAVNDLLDRLRNESYLSVARSLGVSDNAIRKHIHNHARLVQRKNGNLQNCM